MTTKANTDEDDNVAETSALSAQTVDNASLLSRLSARSSFIGPNKFNIVVQLLDRADRHEFEYKKNATGQAILDDICKVANIAEKEYFGLQFEDNKFRYWVDLSKTLTKQFHRKSVLLRLRIRFYPTELACVREAITRYNLFVQVHRDLLHGRIICTADESARLAALVLQASVGDYEPATMGEDADYVSGYMLVMKQSHRIESKIADIHRELKGLSTEEAEREFLEFASRLETYGFDPYVVKNVGQSQEVTVGATGRGVLVFVRGQRVHAIKWADVEKVDYSGKQLTITPTKDYVGEFLSQHPPASSSEEEAADTSHNSSLLFDSTESKGKSGKLSLRFVCPSATFAKHLWRHILSQQVFFTEKQAVAVKPRFSKPKIPLFSRGSTFRCPTARVLHELELDCSPPRQPAEIVFVRHPLRKCQLRSVDEPWNVSRSSSQQQSVGQTAEPSAGNFAAETSATAPNIGALSTCDSCDGHSTAFLDATVVTNATHNHSGSFATTNSSSIAHPEEIREAMANGAFNIFDKHFSNSSLKNGGPNGSVHADRNGVLAGQDVDAKSPSKRGVVAKASLFLVVFFAVLTLAFLVAYVFYPDTLKRIELPRVAWPQWPKQFHVPPWLMPGTQTTRK